MTVVSPDPATTSQSLVQTAPPASLTDTLLLGSAEAQVVPTDTNLSTRFPAWPGSWTSGATRGDVMSRARALSGISYTGLSSPVLLWVAPDWGRLIGETVGTVIEGSSTAWRQFEFVMAKAPGAGERPLETTSKVLALPPLVRAVAPARPVALARDATSDAPPTAHAALNDIATWTRLPADELARLWNTSRRTVYNWLEGRAIREDTAEAILATHESLVHMVGSRDPYFLRRWLLAGRPSPAELIHSQDWQALRRRVKEATASVHSVADHNIQSTDRRDDAGYGADLIRSMSRAVRGIVSAPQWVAPAWTPKELTGLTIDDDADDGE
jgi:DNA-binding transcriptional regulator YiaG